MSENNKTLIRVFVLEDDGSIWDAKTEFDVESELSGEIPAAGDVIVSQWVSENADRRDPRNRTFYEVQRRYWCPGQVDRDGNPDEWVYVGLLVRQRCGREDEWDVFNN